MRQETGPMKFGDDWTGLFIRGDNAMYYGVCLEDVLESLDGAPRPGPIQIAALRGLLSDLYSSREGFKKNPQRAILVTDEPTKDQE